MFCNPILCPWTGHMPVHHALVTTSVRAPAAGWQRGMKVWSILTARSLFSLMQVAGLVDKAVQGGQTLWRVRWHGYTEADDTWEPTGNTCYLSQNLWFFDFDVFLLCCPQWGSVHCIWGVQLLKRVQRCLTQLPAAAECLDMAVTKFKWLGAPHAKPTAADC